MAAASSKAAARCFLLLLCSLMVFADMVHGHGFRNNNPNAKSQLGQQQPGQPITNSEFPNQQPQGQNYDKVKADPYHDDKDDGGGIPWYVWLIVGLVFFM